MRKTINEGSPVRMWAQIEGTGGKYWVSTNGDIFSFTSKKCLKHNYDGFDGYPCVQLKIGDKRVSRYIHRLVAEAFIFKPDGCNIVNHLDYDFLNPFVGNLEWTTQQGNVQYSAHRMSHPKRGTYSSTGEKYVYERNGRFRVVIDRKERTFATITEAVSFRNEVLENAG